MNKNIIKDSIIFWLVPVLIICLFYFKDIILIFLTSLILGSIIQSLAFFINHRLKINYYFTVILFYFLILITLIFIFYILINVILNELPSLLEKINPYVNLLKNLSFIKNIQNFISFDDYIKNVFNILNFIFNSLAFLILILVTSFYISLSKNFPENLLTFFNINEEYGKIFRYIRRKLSFWFMGQVILMLFIGIIVYIFLALILKIKYAFLLSLTAAILEFIPILGPLITLLIIIFIVSLENFNLIIPTVIFFVLLQQIENHFLVPLIMHKAINIHPLLIIFGVIIGAKIGGILGIFVIIPIIGVLIEFFKLLKIKKHEKRLIN